MRVNSDNNDVKAELNKSEAEQQGKCPDKPSKAACGSCPGCSGQSKKTSTVYYLIPALIIIVLALILKYFGII